MTLVDKVVDDEAATTSTNNHPAKYTILLLQNAERDSALIWIQNPPGMTSRHDSTAFSVDTSRTSSTSSNVPEINPTKSSREEHLHRFPQHGIVTRPD